MKHLPGLLDGLGPDGRKRIQHALRSILSYISVFPVLSETGKTIEDASADLARGWLDISELNDACSDESPFSRSGNDPHEFCMSMCQILFDKIRCAAGHDIAPFISISETGRPVFSGEPLLVLSEATKARSGIVTVTVPAGIRFSIEFSFRPAYPGPGWCSLFAVFFGSGAEFNTLEYFKSVDEFRSFMKPLKYRVDGEWLRSEIKKEKDRMKMLEALSGIATKGTSE